MKEVQTFPKISIVTPSYNQGKYIEDTILSVIGQNYPNLEYIIIDGGSNDETIDIIKKYQNHISYWVSEKDNGQSHAINKGFDIATGEIIGWLNSDDIYMPNCLSYIVKQIKVDDTAIHFGNCLHFKEGVNGLHANGSNVVGMFKSALLENVDFIIQPSTFWTRNAWKKVGKLREDIHYAFDWEWFLRAMKVGVTFYAQKKCLSMYRIHEEHKSGNGGNKRQQEILNIYKEYSNKYAKLYELVMNEDFNRNTLNKKIARKLLGILRKPNSNIDIIKLFKAHQYKDYSHNEIAYAISML